jgi:hypothetical protein
MRVRAGSISRARRGLLCLALCAAGCGGDEAPPLATVRPMQPVERAAAAPETLLPELELAVQEPAAPQAQPNRPPRVRAMQVDPAPDITAGSDVRVVVNADDPDGDPLEIEYRWFVNGERVDAEGAQLSTRSLRRGDTVRVEAVARDGREDSAAMASPLLTVRNGVPEIVSEPEGAGPDGRFRYQVRVRDPEGDVNLRYKLAEAPRGMRIHPVLGLVEWNPGPEQAGTHPVEIVVEDSAGSRGLQRFELIIGSR